MDSQMKLIDTAIRITAIDNEMSIIRSTVEQSMIALTAVEVWRESSWKQLSSSDVLAIRIQVRSLLLKADNIADRSLGLAFKGRLNDDEFEKILTCLENFYMQLSGLLLRARSL